MSSNWFRRLVVDGIRSRAKREEDGRCGLDEYFDAVVGQCSLCSELCQPQRGTDSDCTLNCASYMRMKLNKDSPYEVHFPINSDALSSSLSSPSSSSSSPSFSLQTVIVISSVAVVCVFLAVFIAIVGLNLLRRKKTNSQSPINEDDIEDKFVDPSKRKMFSLELTTELQQQHLISPAEESFQEGIRRHHCAMANDRSASLCSNSVTQIA